MGRAATIWIKNKSISVDQLNSIEERRLLESEEPLRDSKEVLWETAPNRSGGNPSLMNRFNPADSRWRRRAKNTHFRLHACGGTPRG